MREALREVRAQVVRGTSYVNIKGLRDKESKEMVVFCTPYEILRTVFLLSEPFVEKLKGIRTYIARLSV